MFGFFSTVTIVLAILKLENLITWHWFWVLSPMLFWLLIWVILITLFVSFGVKVYNRNKNRWF